MKKIGIALIVLIFAFGILACNNSETENNKSEKNNTLITQTDDLIVYYFHTSHRCETCVAVEDETKKALNELYPEKMKSDEISFKSIDMDEKEGEELSKAMEISGQTLIFIKSDKKIDLTNEGFLYAVSTPEKLKSKIKETVDELIK